MPLTGDEYRQRSAEEILTFLAAELRSEFGEDIDLTQSSAFRTFAEALSTVDADEIEPALQQVHEAAFLQSASGENLERLVAILGISRRSSTHATGVVEFRHGETATSDYTIRNGITVQTSGAEPTQFETTELVTITAFDDFEGGSLSPTYGGQTGDFAVVDGSASGDPSPYEGDGMLRADAVSGSKVFDDSRVVERGSKMDFRLQLGGSGAAGANIFGIRDASNYYRVRVDNSGEHAVEIVTPSGATTLANDTSVAPPTGEWLRSEVVWEGEEDGRITARLYDEADTLLSEVRVTGEDEIAVGGFGFESLDGTTQKYWDISGERAVQADARATEGGVVGNVGSNTLTVMPTIPDGVEKVTNPWPMGDDDHRLTSTVEFATGRPEETDDELRDRASQSEGATARATIPALIANLRSLPEAESISVYENRTDSTQNGLPPTSFEVVYYGSDPPQLIADELFATKGFTAHDVGGVNGTEVTETVTAENGQTFTMHWSEPTELQVDMTLDIVVNDQFIGEEELADRVVDYIGGRRSDDTAALGTGAGEDIYVDQVEDIVTGPQDTGVIGIGSYSFTPTTTTDGNGLEVVSVGANEVATTSALDASISFNVTRV